jgi:hypothetical protein
MTIDIRNQITRLRNWPQWGKYLATALERLSEGTNNLGKNLGADPTDNMLPPGPVNALNIKTDGHGVVHGTIEDHNEIHRSVHYFVEYQVTDDPRKGFSQPHIVHLGASRTLHPMLLPGLDDNGNPQSYIFRAYSQYPGGNAGEKIAFGGSTPTLVNPGGTTKMTLLPSKGSGTGQADGQQAGVGFGPVLTRPHT